MKNSMKTPDQKKRSKQLGKEIRDNLERYEYLRAHGGSDPFWSDGVNMNLCRKHVIYLRSRTKAALEVLKENQDFRYLRNKLSGDLDKESDQCMNSVRYVLGLEDAIRRDDLVVMRRCQDPEFYVNYLRNSRKKLEVILGSEYLEPKIREGQLTIWDFIGGQ